MGIRSLSHQRSRSLGGSAKKPSAARAASCAVNAVSVQLPARRVVRHDRRHSRSLAELITEPSPKFGVFDFLNREPNRLAKNLSDALFGRALCAVVRYALAELRQH